MNLYLRYFDQEVLVKNADEAIAFLADIDEIGMNPMLERDVREYVESNVMYPKRYKIRPRVYFIIIKTEAESMEDFKETGRRVVRGWKKACDNHEFGCTLDKSFNKGVLEYETCCSHGLRHSWIRCV